MIKTELTRRDVARQLDLSSNKNTWPNELLDRLIYIYNVKGSDEYYKEIHRMMSLHVA